MYTLQAQYLAVNPVVLSPFSFCFLSGVAALGYWIFRTANYQKDAFRKSGGRIKILGEPTKYIRAPYFDGQRKECESLLLTSGFWGLARHANYLGDLLLSYSMCFACGTTHLLPHFYGVYMTVLLLHRIQRDHQRCSAKYGKQWEEYCRIVPHKLIPGIY